MDMIMKGKPIMVKKANTEPVKDTAPAVDKNKLKAELFASISDAIDAAWGESENEDKEPQDDEEEIPEE